MKQITTIFIILLLTFLLCIFCLHRKPQEEGEIFLQRAEQMGTSSTKTNSLQPYHSGLFSTEQEHDFTPVQLIRLKQIQLRQYDSSCKISSQKLVKETKTLAKQISNNKLPCSARWDIFRNKNT